MKIVLSLLFLVAGLGLGKLRETLPSRRLWGISDPSRVVISVAHSAASHTGKYIRPATGIGQVRALALLMPSLKRAYSDLEIRNIYLSSESLLDRLECDLICLGGSKNNRVTADLLDRLGSSCPISMDGSEISWREGSESETYEGTIENDQVIDDFGLIIRTRNPFNRSKDRRSVIILAGSHTYGTIAAARYFCEELGSPLRRRPRSFVALVQAQVRDGYPASPKLIRFAKIR
ncbi:MAG TPA: hypothetical protein VID51_04345 [Solirubrobacterales bacterium]